MEEETGFCGFYSSTLSELMHVFLLSRQQIIALVGFSIIWTSLSFISQLVAESCGQWCSTEEKSSNHPSAELTCFRVHPIILLIYLTGPSLFKHSSGWWMCSMKPAAIQMNMLGSFGHNHYKVQFHNDFFFYLF